MFAIVSVLAGVLVAGLFVPYAGLAGLGSKAAADELNSLPTELATPTHGVTTRAHAELAVHGLEVRLHGVHRHEEVLGDLDVARHRRQHREDRELPLGEGLDEGSRLPRPVHRVEVDAQQRGERVFARGTTLVFSAEETAREVAETLARKGMQNDPSRQGECRFLTTGSPDEFRAHGERFLQLPIGDVEQVAVSELAAASAA